MEIQNNYSGEKREKWKYRMMKKREMEIQNDEKERNGNIILMKKREKWNY